MKITPLFSNPVGWSEQVAKTARRVVVYGVVHIALFGLGLWMIHDLLVRAQAIGEYKLLSVGAMMPGGFLLFIGGVMFPAMYLYALHQLLVLLRNSKNAEPEHGAPPLGAESTC
jgi:hypothetical protein